MNSNKALPPAPKAPLYKYVSGEVAQKILQGSIRFTQPTAFNDPFELLPEIVTPRDQQNFDLPIRFDLAAPRSVVPPSNSEIPDGCVVSDVLSRDIVQRLNSTVGILSLCRSFNSLLMWSHYADQYSGAIIEFDGDHEFFTGLIEVEYRAQRPRWHIDSYLAGEVVPFADLCVKSEDWAYEQEVRIARNLSDCFATGSEHRGFPILTMPLSSGCVTGVYMGERMPVESQRWIYNQVKATDIRLALAAVGHEGFEFRTEIVKYATPIGVVGPVVSPRTAHIFSHLDSPLGEMARWAIAKHPMSKAVNMKV